MIDALGVVGSCTWTTSKSPSASHVFTRAAVRGPKVTRATDPLYGTPTARPDETTYGGDLVVIDWREHRDLMAEVEQGLGQIADMVLHTAGHAQRVRTHHADSHGVIVTRGR